MMDIYDPDGRRDSACGKIVVVQSVGKSSEAVKNKMTETVEGEKQRCRT